MRVSCWESSLDPQGDKVQFVVELAAKPPSAPSMRDCRKSAFRNRFLTGGVSIRTIGHSLRQPLRAATSLKEGGKGAVAPA